jgi:DNA invertase Pin-like site-specific DNA recombinase
MKYGYARVSTDDQKTDLQIAALKKADCEYIYTDTATGASSKRPELTRCLDKLRPGDTLVVWKLDRLGRSRGLKSNGTKTYAKLTNFFQQFVYS